MPATSRWPKSWSPTEIPSMPLCSTKDLKAAVAALHFVDELAQLQMQAPPMHPTLARLQLQARVWEAESQTMLDYPIPLSTRLADVVCCVE